MTIFRKILLGALLRALFWCQTRRENVGKFWLQSFFHQCFPRKSWEKWYGIHTSQRYGEVVNRVLVANSKLFLFQGPPNYKNVRVDFYKGLVGRNGGFCQEAETLNQQSRPEVLAQVENKRKKVKCTKVKYKLKNLALCESVKFWEVMETSKQLIVG